jgi:hypothetical protein
VPPRLAQVIDRCLAKDPATRFATGEALADALGTALDRRAAIAVRAFVTEARHLSTTALLYGATASVLLALSVMRSLRDPTPGTWATVIAVAALTAVVPLAVMLGRVRRLLRAGHGQRDLTDTLRAELTHRREELSFLYGHGPSWLERVLRGVTYACVASAVGIVAAVLGVPDLDHVAGISTAFAIVSACGILAALMARRRTELRTDLKAERRLRFWSGRPGACLFGLAGLGLGCAEESPVAGAVSPAVTPVPDGRDV